MMMIIIVTKASMTCTVCYEYIYLLPKTTQQLSTIIIIAMLKMNKPKCKEVISSSQIIQPVSDKTRIQALNH